MELRYILPRYALWMLALLTGCLATSALSQDVVVAHGIAMHGDLKYPANFTHFAYANPNAPKGGSVVLSGYGTFDSFNPFVPKGDAESHIDLIYDTLLVNSSDEPFSEYGLIAEKVEYARDRSWIIFHLDPRARFHDGKPITAEDVVFSFNILLEKGQPHYRAYYADVAQVEALDERRVKFTSRTTRNRELILILGQLYILPKHYWQERDFNATIEPPLGSGPYRIKSFDLGKTVVYERVKDYWGADKPVRKGFYNFDRITIEYYRDDTVLLEAFKNGRYDFRLENQAKRWATEYNGPAFERQQIIKEEIEHQNPTGMQAFVMNTRRELFKDARVRRALNYAFDFEWTNKHLFYGAYKRTNSFFSNSELAATGLPSGRELALLEPYRDDLPPEVFTQAYQAPVTDGSGRNRDNIRQAIELLKAAGWEYKGTSLVHATTGKPFRFEILLYSKDFERIVLPFVKNLKRLGIDASVRVIDTTNYIRVLREFDFDMVIGGFGQSNSPGNEQRDYWYSKFADQVASRNLIGVKDPVVDLLVDKVIAAENRDELVAACRALDRVLLWNHFVIPQWHINTHRIAYWNKFSRPAVTPIYGDVGFWTWWLKDATSSNPTSTGKP